MKSPADLAKHSAKEFLKIFDSLYEHTPCFVEQALAEVLSDTKYNNLELFHQLISEIMLQADRDIQDSLIKAHPMLAGKKAQRDELTDFSKNEQNSAGLSDCSENEVKLFEELNEKYYAKFNFPFIMAVKEKDKTEILANFRKRQENSVQQERGNALNEINKIAWLRIKEIYAA
ncbi:MAG: 2-oxo-4-hydroxy-4-carboxy-5-ureidoimidazoline decarboxylase [Gammaproteobacteria bacterium]|jgi:OHCU decarboxylase|nr:2-oxo-4-hydroxy-4-carboxy-5-ureidoimidazoline decarboxylase [Gammaproteobacteria bacterium]MDP6973666.1 2-oxo-4-hydroxy-4-carboxy-5-ureidoimidazoline decarboxylase [Gammaproteobacteria bacterium]